MLLLILYRYIDYYLVSVNGACLAYSGFLFTIAKLPNLGMAWTNLVCINSNHDASLLSNNWGLSWPLSPVDSLRIDGDGAAAAPRESSTYTEISKWQVSRIGTDNIRFKFKRNDFTMPKWWKSHNSNHCSQLDFSESSWIIVWLKQTPCTCWIQHFSQRSAAPLDACPCTWLKRRMPSGNFQCCQKFMEAATCIKKYQPPSLFSGDFDFDRKLS